MEKEGSCLVETMVVASRICAPLATTADCQALLCPRPPWPYCRVLDERSSRVIE